MRVMRRTLAAAEPIDDRSALWQIGGPWGWLWLTLGRGRRIRRGGRHGVGDRLAAGREHLLEPDGQPARRLVLGIDDERAAGQQVRPEVVGPLERDPRQAD